MTVELYILDEEAGDVVVTPETIFYEDGCPPLPQEGETIYAGPEGKGWKVNKRTFTYRYNREDNQFADVEVQLFCEFYNA